MSRMQILGASNIVLLVKAAHNDHKADPDDGSNNKVKGVFIFRHCCWLYISVYVYGDCLCALVERKNRTNWAILSVRDFYCNRSDLCFAQNAGETALEICGENPTFWSNRIKSNQFSNLALTCLQLNCASVSIQTLDSHTNLCSSHSLIFGIRELREVTLKFKFAAQNYSLSCFWMSSLSSDYVAIGFD